ncbi:MAG: hypothetical protein LBM70_08755, partial [Victivallales bacterium]|nr:hypothetical protein [Victivallales bacterium]
IGELGYAFLFRNYRPEQGKWQTADPLGYPDGWNNLAYVNNLIFDAIDIYGAAVTYIWSGWQIQQIIGIVTQKASGYVYGNSVTIVWKNTVVWTCTTCKGGGSETFYTTTSYSNDDVVWAAPVGGLGLSIPTPQTLPTLFTEFLATLLDDLLSKEIAANLSISRMQDNKALAAPTKTVTYTHKCE